MKACNQCLARRHHRLSSLRGAVSQDIQRYLTKSPHDLARGDTFKTRLSACLTPEVFPVVLHRVAHYFYAAGWRRLATAVTRINSYLHKVNISPQSCIGPGFRLPHPAGVTFHGQAGRGLTVYSLAICCAQTAGWHGSLETGPLFGDYVTVGAHAVVLGRITVGDRTRIAYSARLDCDAPSDVLVASKFSRPSIRRPGGARVGGDETSLGPGH
jgi:serine O-acetyltransferase